MKEFFKSFPSIMKSQILTSEAMEKVKGGGKTCQHSCKKACKPGNMNRNGGNTGSLQQQNGKG